MDAQERRFTWMALCRVGHDCMDVGDRECLEHILEESENGVAKDIRQKIAPWQFYLIFNLRIF